MIALSPEAEAQLDDLIAHYEALGRVEASINLLNAVERAQARISEKPEAGLAAPHPFPALAKAGRRWIIEGSYWIPIVQRLRRLSLVSSTRCRTFPTVFRRAATDVSMHMTQLQLYDWGAMGL